MKNYHKWVDDNIKVMKSAEEIHSAISWLERNVDKVSKHLDHKIEDPSLQFSNVIGILTEGIKSDLESRKVVLLWLSEDIKVPYGKILKTKALRKLWKHFNRLDQQDVILLGALYERFQEFEYKPTEYKWLEKINAKAQLTRRCS